MVVFVKIFNQRWSALSFGGQQDCSGLDIKRQICETKGISEDDIFLTYNGSLLENHSELCLDQNNILVQCHLRLPGGKGGFGSMLRAIGAQIEKTTNREACRDLSGRRMRDVNDEKKIADWLSKQAERDQEKARRKQERLERLQTAPKHVFEESTAYTSQLQDNMDSIDDALQKGLKSSATSSQSSSSLGKRSVEDKKGKKSHKKRKLWHDMDEDLSSDSGEESDTKSSSSMADSDYSVSGSSDKASSTTTTNELPSGSTSENNDDNPHLCEENAHSFEPETVDTKTNGESNEQQQEVFLTDTKNHEQLVKPKRDQQEALISSVSKVVTEKLVPTLQDTEDRENTVKSHDNSCNTRSEVCSSNSSSSAVIVERNCDDSEKIKDELSSGESVKDKTSSSSVTLPLNLDEYNFTAELETLGLEVLKSALISMGLKCGGTLQQRAERLFSIKGIPREKIDPSLFAKKSGGKEKKR